MNEKWNVRFVHDVLPWLRLSEARCEITFAAPQGRLHDCSGGSQRDENDHFGLFTVGFVLSGLLSRDERVAPGR